MPSGRDSFRRNRVAPRGFLSIRLAIRCTSVKPAVRTVVRFSNSEREEEKRRKAPRRWLKINGIETGGPPSPGSAQPLGNKGDTRNSVSKWFRLCGLDIAGRTGCELWDLALADFQ